MLKKCCCTLRSGTIIGLILSGVQAIFGLFWNIELLMLLNENDEHNPLHCLIDVHALDDYDAVHGLTLAAIGLNGFWLFFALLATRANITLTHGHLALWDHLTILITVFDIGTAIYFGRKFQECYAENPAFFTENGTPTTTLTHLVLMILFSRAVILIPLNICTVYVVQLRRKEVNHDHSALALYIISHLGHGNDDTCPLMPEIPAVTPGMAIPATGGNRSDSNSSQWSLSYENMSLEPPKYVPPSSKRVVSSLALARALSSNPSCRTTSVDSTGVENLHASVFP